LASSIAVIPRLQMSACKRPRKRTNRKFRNVSEFVTELKRVAVCRHLLTDLPLNPNRPDTRDKLIINNVIVGPNVYSANLLTTAYCSLQ